MDDLVAFLRATLDAAERTARAAADYNDGAEHDVQGPPGTWVLIPDEKCFGPAYPGGMLGPRIGHTNHVILGEHIVRHDPATVLRRIDADRKQLELHAAVPDHGRFSERGCDATCDGVHDEPPVCRSCRDYAGGPVDAPCRTVEILATGWGWSPTA